MSSDRVYTLALLVTAFLPEVSGAAQFNWERAQWLAKQGNHVIVFAPDWQNSSDSQLTLLDLDKRLIIERYPSKPWFPYKLTYVPKFLAAHQIGEKLAHYKPDLIVMTDVERFFLLTTWQLPGKRYAKRYHIPYIAEYHTDIYNFASAYPGWQWLGNTIRRSRLASYLYHKFDLTICPSSAASKSCQEAGILNTHIIRFYGINVSSYSPCRRSRKWLEPWLSVKEQDNQVLLFLGRLGFEKRVDLLIEAFARLKRKEPNCSLIIAGDGPVDVVSQLQRLAAPFPDIHFTGFILGEMKANLLASCDVFCSPSPYETFGRTIVEAMASGIPVVTVDSGAVSEYIVHGVNGYLVQPNNAEALANAIHRVLLSNNTEIIQHALHDVDQFSVEQGCKKLNNYYQQLLNQGFSGELVNGTKTQYN